MSSHIDYQHALLDHIGIRRWTLRQSALESLNESQDTLVEVEQTDAPSQQPLSSALKKMRFNESEQCFVQDVLQYWLNERFEGEFATGEMPEDVLWFVGEQLSFEGNTLFTPPLNELMRSAQLKRDLFDLLHQAV